MKYKYHIYIALFFAICLIPSAGLLLGGVQESSENRETAHAPVLMDEDGFNTHFLNDAGEWFEDHFAFRNEWVTGYAMLMEKVFGVSSQESVIVGTDGWLYYKDSLNDFQGAGQMTGRQLFNVAHSMAMLQEYARENGVKAIFTVAPNKNSLYGENMPYFYQAFHTEGKNAERLLGYLEKEGVNYVDLYGVLGSKEQALYHKRDSHWNNEGAALAADAILSSLGKEHPSYSGREYSVRKDFAGDLDKMLFPAAVTEEEEIYYEPLPQFSYCEEVESNFEPKISTTSQAEGSLVMYRDSFGNALLPYMAEAYGNAFFSRALPYYLPDLKEHGADTLVIERAERFLPDMAGKAPYMEAPAVKANVAAHGREVEIADLEVTGQGALARITGKVPMDSLQEASRIYVKVNGKACYEAFPVTSPEGQEGFSMLLAADALLEEGNVFEVFLSED